MRLSKTGTNRKVRFKPPGMDSELPGGYRARFTKHVALRGDTKVYKLDTLAWRAKRRRLEAPIVEA